MIKNPEKCLICDQDIESNHHFKKHKLSVSEYYEQYYPKYDLYTNEKIEFKDCKEKYFGLDFINKTNLKKWLLQQEKIKAESYLEKKLLEKKHEKNWIYVPTEVELDSSTDFPSRKFIETVCDFDSICKNMGLKERFKKCDYEIKPDIKYKDNPDYWIDIDPREQKPLNIKYPKQIKTLKFGDYSLNRPEDCGNIFVERKSLIDLICTLSGNYERFLAEIIRCKQANSFLIVLVEEPMKRLHAIPNSPQFRNTRIKAKPDYILYKIRNLMSEYDNINFIFCDGRKDAVQVLYKILFSNGACKEIDIQLARANGLI